jgi:hypothetical protein
LKIQERDRMRRKLTVSDLNTGEQVWEIMQGKMYWLVRLDMKKIIAEVII